MSGYGYGERRDTRHQGYELGARGILETGKNPGGNKDKGPPSGWEGMDCDSDLERQELATPHKHNHTDTALPTVLHCPFTFPPHLHVTPQRVGVGCRIARGERENARVLGTGEQDEKLGTGTPRDLGSALGLGPVISVGRLAVAVLDLDIPRRP